MFCHEISRQLSGYFNSIQFNLLVLIRIRETNRSQIPLVGEEKTQAYSYLRPHLSFTDGSWWLFISDSNAWISCLFCGPGDSTTNGHPRFYLSLTPTGGPFAKGVRCCSGVNVLYPIQWAEAFEERGGTYSGRGTHLLTGSSSRTTTTPQSGFMGTAPSSVGRIPLHVSLLSHEGLKTPYKVRHGLSSILRKVCVLLTLLSSDPDHTPVGIEAPSTTQYRFCRPAHDIIFCGKD